MVPDGGDMSGISDGKTATVAEIGLTSKDIHTARQVRDAERASPGIIDRRIDEMLAARFDRPRTPDTKDRY